MLTTEKEGTTIAIQFESTAELLLAWRETTERVGMGAPAEVLLHRMVKKVILEEQEPSQQLFIGPLAHDVITSLVERASEPVSTYEGAQARAILEREVVVIEPTQDTPATATV